MEQEYSKIQREILYGKRVIEEALAAGKTFEEIYVSLSFKQEYIKFLKEKGIPVSRVKDETIAKICGSTNHQGIMGYVSTFKYSNLEELLDLPGKERYPVLLALDEIQDPHNLGAILRCAEGAGVSGVIMGERRTAPINSLVAKISAGSVFHLKIVKVKNLLSAIIKLKNKGYWVFGTHQDGDTNYFDFDFSLPSLLVMGSEGKGLRENIKKECDYLLRIPMKGKVDSLNVSVATAIILFEIAKQHQIKKE